MRAPKLVQHMKANADRMSEALVQKIREHRPMQGTVIEGATRGPQTTRVGNLPRPHGLAGG